MRPYHWAVVQGVAASSWHGNRIKAHNEDAVRPFPRKGKGPGVRVNIHAKGGAR